MGWGLSTRAGNLVVCAAALIRLSAASAASADESSANQLSFSYVAGATSDYVFRGVSQTSDRPSLFVGANVVVDEAYAGIWTSNVDFTPFGDRSTSEEIDLSLGLVPQLHANPTRSRYCLCRVRQ
jgi:uncharacterized protein (TIGR02001 family)